MKLSVTVVFTLLFGVVSVAYVYLKPRPLEVLSAEKMISPTSSSGKSDVGLADGSLKIEKNPDKPEGPIPLIDLSAKDDIVWMQIQNRDRKESITFVKDAKEWHIKFPVDYKASHKMVQDLSSAILKAERIRQAEPEKGWEEYGLLRPAIKIGVQTKKNPERRYLYLGDRSPIGDYIFARWYKEETYFLLPGHFLDFFDRSLYASREKRVFRSEGGGLTMIRLQTKSEGYELANEKGIWVWKKPNLIHGLECPPEIIKELKSQLQDLFIKEYLDKEKGSAEQFGISNSGAYISIWDQNNDLQTLYIGNETLVRDAYYGRLKNDDVFVLIDRNNIHKLFQTISSVASDRLING